MLKDILEEDAKLFLRLLASRNKLTIQGLQDLTDYHEMYTYMIIGWLSKGNMIICSENDNGLILTLNHKLYADNFV